MGVFVGDKFIKTRGPLEPKRWCKDTECPYHIAGKVEVPYIGDTNSDILIVGESPGAQEIIQQQPFIGPSGQILNAVLDSIGYSRGTVCIANACRCMISKEEESVGVQNEALRHCRSKLERLIHQMKPKVIVALGAVALKQLTGQQKIMENRGKFFFSEEFGCQIFCTVHPAFVLRGATREFWNKPAAKRSMKENLLFVDFGQVARFIEQGRTDSLDTAEYRLGKNADIAKLRLAKRISVDFETTGLDLANPDVRCLSVAFCAEEGKPVVFFADGEGRFPTAVNQLLESDIQKVVASRPFEERVCRQKLGFKMGGKVHDVLTMAHVLDENGHSYGLEAVADIYTPLKGIKSLAEGMRGDLSALPKDKLLLYNAVDADATLRAFNRMRTMLKSDPQLLRYYAFLIQPVQEMFADIYFNGCPIDAEQLGKDEQELTDLIQSLHDQAIACLPPAIRKIHEGKLKLSRPQISQDFLFLHPKGLRLKPNKEFLTPKTRKPQISEDHLMQFRDRTPFIDLLLRMKKAEKILGTYIKNIWACMKPDGKVYPETLFTRTVTGRTVMQSPTIQTIPQRGEFAAYAKRCFVAPKGWLFGARDLGQSEIRVMGWQANDPNILKALTQGIDIHTMTAAIVNKVPISKVTKEMRQKAKGVNFGFLYGMGARKFQVFAKYEYGLDLTEEQCVAIREAFFAFPNGYYKLPEYHRHQSDLVMAQGYVRSPLGRIRRLPGGQSRDFKEQREAARQAVNFPIQSFSSDLGLIGMYLFWQELEKHPRLKKNVRLMWFIHDAVYFQAKEEYFAQAMALLKRCMEVDSKRYIEEKFKRGVGYPITSDGKSGESWASMKDYKEAGK